MIRSRAGWRREGKKEGWGRREGEGHEEGRGMGRCRDRKAAEGRPG